MKTCNAAISMFPHTIAYNPTSFEMQGAVVVF